MRKMNVANGLDVQYRNLVDLNEKVRELLLVAQKEREESEKHFRDCRKKEMELKRFLGMKEEPEAVENS